MNMTSFQEILDRYRKKSFSERDKGNRFERLMQTYLQTDPQYATRFKNVWLWNEFPGKLDLGGGDTGIDLVALTYEGDYWAIQCKCFQENSSIDKPAVDTFLSTSSREFKNEEFETTRFAHRLWISTTNNWGRNATEAIQNQHPPVTRINLFDLQEAPVDWGNLDKGIHGEAARLARKTVRPHQKEAIDKTQKYFQANERGKLIMACGTGKTFTSLRIAENETSGKGLILFLVPSIALLGQTLREWSADAEEPINAICICSDPEVSKKKSKSEDADHFNIVDLALPASTDTKNILHQFRQIQQKKLPGMTVVFSTYQSIDVIARAQKVLLQNGFDEFDLIICDEAHRTTGVSLAGEDESSFTKVHNNDFIKAKKRLYMTATPRLYNEDAKSRAAQAEAILCSMDDTKLYGEEIYRIGFGEAVERDLLTDYKVLILTLSDKDVPPAVQNMLAGQETEIDTDDISKLIGCVNALSKQFIGDDGVTKAADPEPMRRAVAFCQKIAISKKITETYNTATDAYISALPADKKDQMVSIESKHIDGTMSAPQRDELLGWLKAETQNNECRVLTNVRCLSEGVDVPSLDAVLFLSARNSQVEVVQSVGRVMRRAPGKKYGYIIIPVVVPADEEADKVLNKNERYKVVWTVLNALRAHDDRFNSIINKIELNKKRPAQIMVGTPAVTFDDGGAPVPQDKPASRDSAMARQLALQFEQLQGVIFARMVQKVGDRLYWEQWAKDVAEIAQRQIEIIHHLLKVNVHHKAAFDEFLDGLRKNINPSVTSDEAVEMLAQHIITRPVFETLFEGYSFVQNNAISQSMQKMLDLLLNQTLEKESDALQKFYESVKKRAAGIDNAEGRQRIIIELYDKFFRSAFPKMVEKLGIVYTPVEVVDFIIHSVNDVLKKEFGRGLTDENVHILDPFTGTGTFITRLLESGLIEPKDLQRKYKNELHCNEMVLLAYYIACVNIENVFHDLAGETQAHQPFEGILLTDTFQLNESMDYQEKYFSSMFPENSARVQKQKNTPIRVIMTNPPYSVGQKSANDNAQNQKYEKLDARIEETYGKGSKATSIKSLYDAYIKAFRWGTDRLDPKNGGVVAMVTNGSWLDGNAQDGFRKCLEEEFSSIWVFNLRGNQRTSGELSRQEGGKIFGSGSRTPIAITLLVKNPQSKNEKATIHYHDIGDYLNREDKLKIISEFASTANPKMQWKTLEPNQEGDWLGQRNDVFGTFIPLVPEKKFESKSQSYFISYSLGIGTNRDVWVFNSSRQRLIANMKTSTDFYNSEVERFEKLHLQKKNLKVTDFVNNDPTKISWSSSLLPCLERKEKALFDRTKVIKSLYRPFFKQYLYTGDKMIHRRGQMDSFFPTPEQKNLVICVSGVGVTKRFSTIITDTLPDLELIGKSQCFPLYYYEERDKKNLSLFDGSKKEYIRRDGVSDFILQRAKVLYGARVGKEDIFYYVYGLLHSEEYRTAFANDLKKMLPRLPLLDEPKKFWQFSNAGRKLAELHINYETVPAYEGVKVVGLDRHSHENENPERDHGLRAVDSRVRGNDESDADKSTFYTVEKMRFPKKGQKDTIIYNSQITIENIPAKAYEYIVNGKSAIEWIMDRYQVTTHKASGIKNDPNDWAQEVGNPRYILDLLLSIINVSMQTVDIVNGLPKVKFD